MAKDVYIKFGESGNKSPLYNTPLPKIEGDSDDTLHHWWCELRSCSFEMENPHELLDGEAQDPSSSGTSEESGAPARPPASPAPTESKKPTTYFQDVTIKKRIDWASTQLFLKCCEAAESAAKKTKEEQEKGLIDQVTVHVCRPVGDSKIPFVIVKYYGVRLKRYKVSMSGPEPSEDITFEFEAVEYDYQRTDPYDGLAKVGLVHTGKLDNKEKEHKEKQQQAASGSESPATSGPSVTVVTPGAAPQGNSPGSSSLSSSNEQRAQRTFRGLRSGTGRGTFRN